MAAAFAIRERPDGTYVVALPIDGLPERVLFRADFEPCEHVPEAARTIPTALVESGNVAVDHYLEHR